MNTQGNLRINRAERRFLGVCAGLADYLDVPVVLVRIIFIISVLTWPTLIIGYFVLYFCLDNNITTDKVQEFFSGSGKEHFRKLDYRRPIYRNMHNKRIAGVCSGIADYLEVSTFWVRAAAVLMIFIFGPYAFLAYVIGWFVMEPNVVIPSEGWSARKKARKAARQSRRAARYQRRADRHMHRARKYIHAGRLSDINESVPDTEPDAAAAYAAEVDAMNDESPASFKTTIEDCAQVYYQMESRLRTIEAFITSKRFRLHCEINRA
ncbi:MAG: PspC domain-containing protein [Pseudohongiellaceae bacterium]